MQMQHLSSLNLVQQVFHILQVCPVWLPADATFEQPQSCLAGLPYTASLPHLAACRCNIGLIMHGAVRRTQEGG